MLVFYQAMRNIYIYTVISDVAGKTWHFTGFYGHPYKTRLFSWNLLHKVHGNSPLPWLVCGLCEEISMKLCTTVKSLAVHLEPFYLMAILGGEVVVERNVLSVLINIACTKMHVGNLMSSFRGGMEIPCSE